MPVMNAVGMKTAQSTRAIATRAASDFVHGLVRGLTRAQALPEVTLHVLHDHNRVVHDDADRKHKSEQCKVVKGEAECGHYEECSNQGHWNRDDGDDRGAPGLQE